MIRGLEEEEYFASGHNACAGCGPAIAMRHITKAAGKDVIISHATGCMEVVSSGYPNTAWKVPWVHSAFENAASVASGIERALKMKNDKKTKVLAIGGDGSSFDIGFGALSGMMERGHDICYVCYDNGAYMNTGVQRSGATPKYANTTTTPAGKKIHGKMEFKKPLPFIAAAHRIPYVASASVSNLKDLNKKIKKGLDIEGPTYIEVFSPCPIGWRFDTSKTVEIARLALQTHVRTLYELENGEFEINKEFDQKPVEEYLKMQGRFKHLSEKEVEKIQEHVDKEYKHLKNLEKLGTVL